jgi:2-polyprenyl-3-methyl-5-hydroxy-6-metoxy-1,4-benzoquinol methylase
MSAIEYKCNLCGSDRHRILLKSYRTIPDTHLAMYRMCRDCSFVSVDVEFNEWSPWYSNSLQDLEDSEIRRYAVQETAETWTVINHLLALRKRIPSTVEAIINGDGKLMADIGCGAGGSLLAYQAMGWKTVGVEPGKRAGDYARNTLKFDVKNGDYSESSFPPNSLDMIHSYHTVEHVPFPYDFINLFYYHLRPGGILYIETPNVLDTAKSQLGFEHISLFSKRTFTQTIKSCGFIIIRILDRSKYPTHGIGVLARKREDIGDEDIQVGEKYLTINLPKWQKDNFLSALIKLNYAYWVGRSGGGTWLSVPTRLLLIIAKKYIAPIVRQIRHVE